MLWCEGKCLRSFHPTVDAGEDAGCYSLGMSREEVEAINPFYCENCIFQEHQCFVCGELGSSDHASSNPKVFLCSNATCGHFYHPSCVAQLLYPNNHVETLNLEQKIAAGKAFTCPVHHCYVCKGGENKKDPNWRFAVCRPCPRAYHSKCLPQKILQSELRRTWAGIIPGRILIYCMKHKIVEEIGTPIRNHIKFPSRRSSVFLKREKRELEGKPQQAVQLAQTIDKVKLGSSLKSPLSPTKNQPTKYTNTCSFYVTEKSKLQVKSSPPSTRKPNDVSLQTITQLEPVASTTDHKEIRTRMKALLKASSAMTMDNLMLRQNLPSTHIYSKNPCKDITLGKVEGSVKAVEEALQKFEEGASIEDAKAICEPEILTQIIKWKTKLNVYLGPLLNGPRYTPFGRHFTKLSKMHEVVDLLHWYVQSGDMVVDFCCGSNDFSLLMKEKLGENKKNCSFKNFDIVRPRNDFEFEKKDWMKVNHNDLPEGSKLVMGINPPYGIDCQLANGFINKALRFRPKLVILIVPTKTKRLEHDQYKLIWEDGEMFVGEAFYLPGVINDKGEQAGQCNTDPPHLYLWSRGDWAQKHLSIARQQGHYTSFHKYK